MAIVPNIVLNKGQVLVTIGAGSTIGLTSTTKDFVFGYVEKIYSTCDVATVGDTVLFPLAQSRQIQYGSTMFYVVDETFLLFHEPPPV